ncbi:hypothetical protein Q5H92_08825 [Hymenobacter sp. M29]|uniref:Uncharacterized protein n=1 Tax=Hymenobacter mellowenesis TaxID=3063995 RepID=A0ABT9A9F3_9BACT|nr:hypothetical protein [Hymenobacter sp. M29]MDO7846458.1 hypothetical protein [Hymenobacter sp. M29]
MLVTAQSEFIPRAWAPFDASEALDFWLRNPLLRHFYAKKMAATEALAATLTDNADKLAKTWALRQMQFHCWLYRNPKPEGLPSLSWDEFRDVMHRIEDKSERDQVRSFARAYHLAPYELRWLADRVEAVLAARAEPVLS